MSVRANETLATRGQMLTLEMNAFPPSKPALHSGTGTSSSSLTLTSLFADDTVANRVTRHSQSEMNCGNKPVCISVSDRVHAHIMASLLQALSFICSFGRSPLCACSRLRPLVISFRSCWLPTLSCVRLISSIQAPSHSVHIFPCFW